MTTNNDNFSIIANHIDVLKMAAQLSFKCEGCGWCCTHCDPVTLTASDVVTISDYLKKPLHVVSRKYTHIHKKTHQPSIKKTNPCGFYDVNSRTCKIYPARPLVCRSWPFMSGDYGVNDEQVVGVPVECPGAVKTYQTIRYLQDKLRGEIEAHPEILEKIRQSVDTEQLANEIINITRSKLLGRGGGINI